MHQDDEGVYRYGDFPELFWDLQPDVEVDREDPLIIARVLREGSLPALKKLVDPTVLARELPHLPLPAHIRDFWRSVLEKVGSAESARPV